MSAADKAAKMGWGGMVNTTMTIHDVPFEDNPLEVIPTEEELDELRNGFDEWLNNQTGTLSC